MNNASSQDWSGYFWNAGHRPERHPDLPVMAILGIPNHLGCREIRGEAILEEGVISTQWATAHVAEEDV